MINKQEQSGLALLLFMVVMIGFIIAGFSGFLASSVSQLNEQKKLKNMKALLEAKEALLSYAVDYTVRDIGPGGGADGNVDLYRMGKLPCPDANSAINSEGGQDATCGLTGVNSYGYFPFKTLGRGKIEDASGECLWYVVSGDYKNNPNNMVNRDSLGYLKLVDENDNLKHNASIDNFPIAFIISPGSTIDQDRLPNAALPDCRANYSLAEYLEDGPNINYSTDLPATTDTLWTFLTTSAAVSNSNENYNDQVIAIYRDEFWERINALNDFSFDNSAGVGTAVSTVERLTQSLAVCLASYGNADANRRLPNPAPLQLTDYRVNSNYDDDDPVLPIPPNPLPTRYGRFPQVINYVAVPPIVTTNNFVLNSAGDSYCELATGTSYDEFFWKNWKDHFYYVVSEDFDSISATAPDASKCTVNNCFTIDSKLNKVAAMVIYAGPVEPGKSRVWWWDDATSSVLIDDKQDQTNYLENDNQVVYTGAVQDYVMATSPNDYSYCVEYDNVTFTLSAVKCADL
ncbi:MAG: hypothetical protein GY744_10285 [Gammaproteobacteria bacterium]|nr:hypothetical protein [Gammaproteobacteria bacterium]